MTNKIYSATFAPLYFKGLQRIINYRSTYTQFRRLLDLVQTLERAVSQQANLSINKRSPWAAAAA